MRQHHPASLPFFSVSINGANINYQTLHYSLKPPCGNCHLTTLQQGRETTHASIKGFAGGSTCKASLQSLCCGLGPVTRQCPIVWWLGCSPAGWKHTRHSLPRRPQTKPSPEWGHTITHTWHTLAALHAHCLHGLSSSLRPPAEGNTEFLINSLSHSRGNYSSSQVGA